MSRQAPGQTIENLELRQFDVGPLRSISTTPSQRRKKIRELRRRAKVSKDMNDLMILPGSPGRPTGLDLSSLQPWWKLTIDNVDLSAKWGSEDSFQIVDGQIRKPKPWVESVEFEVEMTAWKTMTRGSATIKIMSKEEFEKFIPLLRINNDAKIEMGWSTDLLQKIDPNLTSAGWLNNNDSTTFAANVQVMGKNAISYDPSEGTWSIVVDFLGYADSLLDLLQTNSLFRVSGSPFGKWYKNEIDLSKRKAEQSNSGNLCVDDGVVYITSLGIVRCLSEALRQVGSGDEYGQVLRKKLLASGEEGGAASFDVPLEITVASAMAGENLENASDHRMKLEDFRALIEPEERGSVSISNLLSDIVQKLTESNRVDVEASAGTNTNLIYQWVGQDWDATTSTEDQFAKITNLKLTSTKHNMEEETTGAVWFDMGNQYSWVRSFSVDQQRSDAVEAKFLSQESESRGVASDPNEPGEPETGQASTTAGPSTESETGILLWPFMCELELMGISGFRIQQPVGIRGLAGEPIDEIGNTDLYDGLYICMGIKYKANPSGWTTTIRLLPDTSVGSFPNAEGVITRVAGPSPTPSPGRDGSRVEENESKEYT